MIGIGNFKKISHISYNNILHYKKELILSNIDASAERVLQSLITQTSDKKKIPFDSKFHYSLVFTPFIFISWTLPLVKIILFSYSFKTSYLLYNFYFQLNNNFD